MQPRDEQASDGSARFTDVRWPLVLYAALFAIACFGLFWRLGDRPLWVDEAETAVLADHVAKLGLPYGSDGRNNIIFPGRETWVNGRGVWIWSPWLDEYIAAASFLCLGKTAFSARLPSVIVSLVSVVWLACFAWRLRRSDELALTATTILVTSIPFYLHARQCRYFALVMLGQVVFLNGFWLAVSGRRRAGRWLVVIGLVVQFYSSYVLMVGNVIALGVVVLLRRRRHHELVYQGLTWVVAIIFATLPWMMYARPVAAQSSVLGFDLSLEKLGFYLRKLNDHVLPFASLGIAGSLWGVRWLQGRSLGRRDAAPVAAAQTMTPAARPEAGALTAENSLVWLLALCIPAHLAVMWVGHGMYFRYQVPLIPVAALLMAEILVRLVAWRSARWGLLVVLCLTNALPWLAGQCWGSAMRLGSPQWTYIQEITTPYTDRLEDVAAYLKAHAAPDDRVLVANEEMPLIFHTNLRIIDARRHSEFDMEDLPEWILTESPSAMADHVLVRRLPPGLVPLYDRIEIQVHDNPRMANHPDIDLRQPFESQNTRPFILYHRNVKRTVARLRHPASNALLSRPMPPEMSFNVLK